MTQGAFAQKPTGDAHCPNDGETVSVADPLIEFETALMVVVPIEIPVPSPEPFMEAMPVEDELQFATDVRSCVLPSL
jgi:hypothetical protein